MIYILRISVDAMVLGGSLKKSIAEEIYSIASRTEKAFLA